MIAVDACASFQASEIRSGVRFGETLAPDGLAAEDASQMLPLLRFRAAGNDGRPGMVECDEAQVIVRCIRTRVFLIPDQLTCERKSETAILLWPRNACPAAFILSLLPGEVEFAH